MEFIKPTKDFLYREAIKNLATNAIWVYYRFNNKSYGLRAYKPYYKSELMTFDCSDNYSRWHIRVPGYETFVYREE